MRYPEERLIPVRSESEVRVGGTYVQRACKICRAKEHALIVIGTRGASKSARGWQAWHTVGCPCARTMNFSEAIPEGRLFRLDTRETTKERTRELERAR